MTGLARRIIEIREAKDLKQKVLAKKAKVPPSTLSRIEAGMIASPRMEILKALAEALEVPVSILKGTIDSDEKLLKVGVGFCLWATPISLKLVEEGGIPGTKITCFGYRGEADSENHPHWFELEPREESQFLLGPSYLNIAGQALSRVMTLNRNRDIKNWDKEMLSSTKVYTANTLLNMLKNDEVDCIVVPSEVYDDSHITLKRAASILYTAEGGCSLSILGEDSAVTQLYDEISKLSKQDHTNRDSVKVLLNAILEKDKNINKKMPAPVVFSPKTVSQEFYRQYLLNDLTEPFPTDTGDWTRLKTMVQELLEGGQNVIFVLGWHPQIHWLAKSFNNKKSKDHKKLLVKDIDLLQFHGEGSLPYLSFDIMFKQRDYLDWKGEKAATLFFDAMHASIENVNKSKEQKDIRQITETMAAFYDMEIETCEDMLRKLNFRFMYYPEWVLDGDKRNNENSNR